ncbi:MAG TPA: R3H domain-containing nucleic acid-binding protein [Dehalococcoidia bacterium]|nr:R3H domain-containing nucleic acid-binding protein [Dehalococcoidia bacterium]
MSRTITDDLDLLLDALAPHIGDPIRNRPDKHDLLEVVMDLGRLPEARFLGREITLSDREVTESDIDYVVSRISEFGEDNRAGIERTLHRISAIRNRGGRIVGLTCRVGRAVFGTIKTIEDIIHSEQSMLLLGRPGVGKTTMLREVARVLADEFNKRVIIVDTSNEIAGDGDIPHPAIGSARRMQVASPQMQHAVMIEAVENHMPEVIVIDEIGTELEAQAARTIAERGVQLVGTAHGNTLENLMANPTLSDLVGGIQSVTLGDEEARRRGTQKSILERKAPPTFPVVVELQSWDRVHVHRDVAETVDSILRGYALAPEIRELAPDGEVRLLSEAEVRAETAPIDMQERRGPMRRGFALETPPATLAPRPVPNAGQRVYPFGISRKRLAQAVRDTGSGASISERLDQADVVITDRSYYRRKPQALRDAEARGVPIYVLKSNTLLQMQQALIALQGPAGRVDPVMDAMSEAEDAIHAVLAQDRPVELTPQSAYIRRLQHELAQRFNLTSQSRGKEPQRRVRIMPGRSNDGYFPDE